MCTNTANTTNYDQALSAKLQSSANALVEQIKVLSGEEGLPALQFASTVCRDAFGTALDPEAYSSLDDDGTRELLPRVEAALASTVILAAVLKRRRRWLLPRVEAALASTVILAAVLSGAGADRRKRRAGFVPIQPGRPAGKSAGLFAVPDLVDCQILRCSNLVRAGLRRSSIKIHHQ